MDTIPNVFVPDVREDGERFLTHLRLIAQTATVTRSDALLLVGLATLFLMAAHRVNDSSFGGAYTCIYALLSEYQRDST